jgi:hypothetical protein
MSAPIKPTNAPILDNDKVNTSTSGAVTNGINGTKDTAITNGKIGSKGSNGTSIFTTYPTATTTPARKFSDMTQAELETALHGAFDQAKKRAWDSDDATPEALVALLATYAIQEVHACGYVSYLPYIGCSRLTHWQ